MNQPLEQDQSKTSPQPKETRPSSTQPEEQTNSGAPDAEHARLREEALIAEQYKQMGLTPPGESEHSMDTIAAMLSTFTEPTSSANASAAKPIRVWKKWLWPALLALVALLGTFAYFFWIRPTLQAAEQEQPPQLLPATAEQTQLGKAEACSGTTLLLYRQMDSSEIASIRIQNSYGTFAMHRNASGAMVLTEHENTALQQQSLAYLLSIVSVPITQMRVTQDMNDLAQYGLQEPAAQYTVTTTSGVSHTVYVGAASPSGAGYYVRYEDREAVYLMSSALAATVLAKETDFAAPYVTVPVAENSYYLQDHFYLYHGDELLFSTEFLPENKRQGLASTRIFKMTYPADYNLSMDNYDKAVLCTLGSLSGTEVLQIGITDEALAAYGLEHPAYTIRYTYQGIEVILTFSEKQEDGSYICASGPYDLIVRVDGNSLAFLEWDLIRFIDRPIFGRRITDITSLSIQGNNVDAHFVLSHGTDASGAATLSVREQNSGTLIESIPDFRNLYKVLLTISIEDYAPYTDQTLPDNAPLLGTVTLTTVGGGTLRYQFFAYSGRRCLYTINGKGEFYVPRDRVEKLLRDTTTLLQGGSVDADVRK